MPTNSPGTRSVDDRRRRRLAQEAHSESARKATSGKVATAAASRASREEKPPLPDESLIPRAPWKIAALAVMGFALWGAMLWLALAEWPRQNGLRQIGALFDGTLPKLLTTAALLLAAQLSYLILWYRSRARKDFQGRYRVWGWAGLFWVVTCLCVTTGLHIPAARILQEAYPLNCWRPELTYWLAPFAVCVLTLYRLLNREMAHCSTSFACWQLTCMIGVFVGGLELGGDLFLPSNQRAELVTAANTFWHGMVTLTYLIHARYVVHVTNEAGAARGSPTWRALRSLLRWVKYSLTLRRVKRRSSARKPAAAPKKKPTPVRKAIAEPDAETPKKRVMGKTVRIDAATETPPAPHVEVPVAAPVKAPAAKAVVAEPARPAAPVAKAAPVNNVQLKQQPAAAPAKVAAPAASHRADDEDDDDSDDDGDVSRMSKKERKKLKQRQRSDR